MRLEISSAKWLPLWQGRDELMNKLEILTRNSYTAMFILNSFKDNFTERNTTNRELFLCCDT